MAKKRIESSLNLGRLLYVPNGFQLSPIRKKVSEKENVILTVARLGTKQKATDILLEAFAQCHSKISDWNLKLIGPIEDGTNEEDFRPFISGYFQRYPHLKDRVIFTGHIADREVLQSEYEKAKIFALPSRHESFGIVIPEALSQGCYVVTSEEVPTGYDIKQNGGEISIVPIDDIQSLADAFIEICNNVKFTPELYERIQDYAYENYSWENNVKPLYDEIMKIKESK